MRYVSVLGYLSAIVAEGERGFLFENGKLVDVLTPGRHRVYSPLKQFTLETVALQGPELAIASRGTLVRDNRQLADKHFYIVSNSDVEVCLVYVDDRLYDIVPPGCEGVYWKEPFKLRFDKVAILSEFALSRELALIVARTSLLGSRLRTEEVVLAAEVPDGHVGLLIVDGVLHSVLRKGFYAYWRYRRNIQVKVVDCRLQSFEVSGQEILTKDKVSIRVTLGTTYSVADAERLATSFADYQGALYRELQFALREAVGTKTLDELLSDKEEINRSVHGRGSATFSQYGLDLKAIGVKDIILPGEMRSLLNQVVEAEKSAQANLIKRREEVAATRSLLNTAKLMEDSPTLMRLKELETLERLTEKVEKFTVFGGFDGMLHELVRIPRLTSADEPRR